MHLPKLMWAVVAEIISLDGHYKYQTDGTNDITWQNFFVSLLFHTKATLFKVERARNTIFQHETHLYNFMQINIQTFIIEGARFHVVYSWSVHITLAWSPKAAQLTIFDVKISSVTWTHDWEIGFKKDKIKSPEPSRIQTHDLINDGWTQSST